MYFHELTHTYLVLEGDGVPLASVTLFARLITPQVSADISKFVKTDEMAFGTLRHKGWSQHAKKMSFSPDVSAKLLGDYKFQNVLVWITKHVHEKRRVVLKYRSVGCVSAVRVGYPFGLFGL